MVSLPQNGLAQVNTDGGIIAPVTRRRYNISFHQHFFQAFPISLYQTMETSRRRDGFGLASVDKWLYFLNESMHPNLVKAFP
jgi:hypothetical protein